MSQELIQAVMVLTKQKGFAPEVIFESLEAALLQAYRKEPTSNPDAYVVIDRETGDYKVMAKKQVVETVELPETEISLLEARKIDKRFEIESIRPGTPTSGGTIISYAPIIGCVQSQVYYIPRCNSIDSV